MAENINSNNRNASARERRDRRAQVRPSREDTAAAVIQRPTPRRASSRPQAQSQASSFESLQVKLTQTLSGDSRRQERRTSASRQGQATTETRRRTVNQGTSDEVFGLHPRRERRTSNTRPSVPPVMVRAGSAPELVRRPRQKVARRRFDLSLGVPGAEMRLPSVPAVSIGMRAASALLAVLMITSLFFLWKSPAFTISTVQAEGLNRLTVGDLNAVMGIVGSSIFGIDPAQVEKRLSATFPELSNISIKASLPAQLRVVATERQPVIAWLQDGKETWVDADGVTFQPRGNPGSLVRVEGNGIPPAAISQLSQSSLPGMIPAVETNTEPARLPADLVSAVLNLGGKVPAETVLVYDSQYGLGWHDPNGWEVYFGTQGVDMDMKMAVYQSLVEYLQNNGIQPALISVEYVHAPFYRMER